MKSGARKIDVESAKLDRRPGVPRSSSPRWTRGSWRGVIVVIALLGAGLGLWVMMARKPPRFESRSVSDIAGDCKMAGDIDGDGLPDVLIAGKGPSEPLTWYRYPDWRATVIAASTQEWSNDGKLGDIDGDGDLDIVLPDGRVSPHNVFWFENPRPRGDPADGLRWKRHSIGYTQAWCKDVHLSDFDGDGQLDVAVRPKKEEPVRVFFQEDQGRWSEVQLTGLTQGLEGMGAGDIDADGDTDLVLCGTWVENPGGARSRVGSEWQEHSIGEAPSEFKVAVADVDRDGMTDIVYSSSESLADVTWWRQTPSDGGPRWDPNRVDEADAAHTLLARDFDCDGDTDLVVSAMKTRDLWLYANEDGSGIEWRRKSIDRHARVHNGVVVDLDADGDWDIFGAGYTGDKTKARVWVNQTDPPGGAISWTYVRVSEHHEQTFGLTFVDVDRDGRLDIASGGYWYRNPGGDLRGKWIQWSLPDDFHAFATLDVDGDGNSEIIAQRTRGDELELHWLAAQRGGADWTVHQIGSVPATSYDIGSQGWGVAQVIAGDLPELIVASGKGLYLFEVPTDPENAWSRSRISPRPSDEGLDVGDLDRDGDLDLVATTGTSKLVEWYENRGRGDSDWPAHSIDEFTDAVFPDRVAVADLNEDGRLDVVVTEENGWDQNAQTVWWEAPEDPTTAGWKQHSVASQASTHSLSAADINGDQHVDLVLAEHKGARTIAVWFNDGFGHFRERLVDRNKESHLGGKVVDLDADGDLDIVSIGYFDAQFVHLWVNEQRSPVKQSLRHDP